MTATIKTETTKTENLPTHEEAVKAFDLCLSTFADSGILEESVIRTAYLGISNGIQVRDYALGAVGLVLPVSDSVRFLSIFKVAGESAHIEAIKGAYAYEAGEIEIALGYLASAHALDPKNSLASLLVRVISAGWPSGAFVNMREELHPKVVAHVATLSGVIVGEESAN